MLTDAVLRKATDPMRVARLGLAMIAHAAYLILTGCTSNTAFHTHFAMTAANPPDPSAVVESHPDYKLGFVEFDDQGWFYNYNQLDFVENMIRMEAGLPLMRGASSRPVSYSSITPRGIILVAFVHGWKDNASSTGDCVGAVRGILDKLSKGEQARALLHPEHPARRVVGVYVGWRGLSATVDPFEELSFWGRKDTAHRVGGYGGLSELLVGLESIQKDSDAALHTGELRSELIIIGHSFGGAAVYSALSQIITERFTQALHNKEPLKPLGDQVILLNPAFEAQRHYDLNQMARSIRQYPHQDQRPVLTIFTSKGDWATHYAFPVGQFFGTLLFSNRSTEQYQANLDAVGWHDAFKTHELDFRPNGSIPTGDSSAGVDITTTKPTSPELKPLQKSLTNIQSQRSKWDPNRGVPQTYEFDQCVLKPLDGFKPGDPFLVVSMDPRIMSGHTDITNPVLNHFLWEYIQFCQPELVIPEKK
jgi:hypothetical protein